MEYRPLDMRAERRRSLKRLDGLGIPTNPNLPLLAVHVVRRSLDEVVDRLLSMHVVAAVAYGFNPKKAMSWVDREVEPPCFTDDELAFLDGATRHTVRMREQIEGMWALAWAVNIVSECSPVHRCPDDFVSVFPDVKRSAPTRDFRESARLRASDSIVAMCDLFYCAHWAVVEAGRESRRLLHSVDDVVVVERRRALEWLISDESWDLVRMDT